jgi:hypothetical protein
MDRYTIPDHIREGCTDQDGGFDIDAFDRLDREHTWSILKAMRANPPSYFAKENQPAWTRYLGVQDGAAYTRDWALGVVRLSHSDHNAIAIGSRLFAEQWPLPVGRNSLEAFELFCERFIGRKRQRNLVIPSLLPFEGDERAMVIVDAVIAGTRVEAFGLVKSHPNTAMFRPGDIKFRVVGNPSTVSQYCDDLKSWWTFLSKRDHPRGRRRKHLSYPDAADAWGTLRDLYEERREHRGPTQRDFCDYLKLQGISIGTTSLGNHIKQWRDRGLPWPPADREQINID